MTKVQNGKLDITKKWIVVTIGKERICWGPSKYILSHFVQRPEIQFSKDVKVEIMTKTEAFNRMNKKKRNFKRRSKRWSRKRRSF